MARFFYVPTARPLRAPSNVSTYVIGDVQGCASELDALLALIRFDAQSDRVYFVGDLVNRGPDSAGVLRRVKALADAGAADSVLGNHDFFLVMAQEGFSKLHPGDTLDQVLAQPDAAVLVDWLRQRPLLIEHGDTLIVHAGLLPAWSGADARSLAREIERELRGPNYRAFLQHLFGNDPTTWHDSLTGLARHRVIVNAFARLRFCTAFSELEFREKRDAHYAPAGFAPWYALPGRRSAGAHTIAGHWSSEGLRRYPGVSLLDSGCLWGGALTALRLDDGALFQVPSQQPLSLAAD
uniref:bis(5'-nucleosyl)-tetraphosphatase (symmetrical) n=1 Tax=uncultured bacterium A1Q1_fos_504 TaxID=1256580 RepID=L7VRU6_9BACT|nr:bis(5'-nucleosyl)-tetraphosphatase, symmetrical [uncultured bacterium A1Q1_fos_504]